MEDIGCPTWIRTRTKASKGPCATVTPSDNPPKISFVPLRRKENFLFATDLAAFEESFHPVVITEKLEPLIRGGPVARPAERGNVRQRLLEQGGIFEPFGFEIGLHELVRLAGKRG